MQGNDVALVLFEGKVAEAICLREIVCLIRGDRLAQQMDRAVIGLF